MKKIGIILSIIVVLFSCNKEKNYNFPRGRWIMNTFVLKQKVKNGYSCSFGNKQYTSLLNNCVLEYDGVNKLKFDFNGEMDELKILKMELNTDSSFFIKNYYSNPNNYDFASVTNYTVTLRTKKLKRLLFKYSVINDSILIGTFWQKGQQIYSYDSPNYTSIAYQSNNPNLKQENRLHSSNEILGVYYLQK